MLYKDLLSSEGLLEWKALLHYKGEASVIGAKSPFFIAPNGYADPFAELNATIGALKNDPNAQCTYPARLDLLLKQNAIGLDDLPIATCGDYQEYLQKVPFDRVYLVFTAEDHTSPASIMGHTIVKIAGEDQDGVTREHSFAFMALMSQSGNLARYINAVFSGTEGGYVLSPYQETIQTYIYGEARSLWEFELVLSSGAKERLRKHLWELKQTPISYQFITHNCNTAMEAILNAADPRFADNERRLFATPVEYLQMLEARGAIRSVSVRPSAIDKAYFAQGKTFYPLNVPSASRFSVQIYEGGFKLSAMPTYRDIRSVSNASAVEFENKLIEVTARYENDKARLEKLDLIAMKTIADYSAAGLSKRFRLGIDESDADRLSPVLEWGRGAGVSPIEGATLYALGTIGYAQGKRANPYALIEAGAIARLGDWAKLSIDYTRFFDADDRYRGFKAESNAYIAYAVSRDCEVNLAYSRRFEQTDRGNRDRKSRDRFMVGASVYF